MENTKTAEDKPDFEKLILEVLNEQTGLTSNLRKLNAIVDKSIEKRLCEKVWSDHVAPLKKRIEELEAMVLKIDRSEHDKIVLTNKNGDTYTSTSEALIDFLHDYPSTNGK